MERVQLHVSLLRTATELHVLADVYGRWPEITTITPWCEGVLASGAGLSEAPVDSQ